MTITSIPETRREAVRQSLDAIHAHLSGGIDRDRLTQAAQWLEQLARRPELFPNEVFPPPDAHEGEAASTLYRLNADDGDDSPALYLNSLNPGKSTWPHNHTTWVILVAIAGQEINRIYRRTDDGGDPAYASLTLEREVVVQPGSPLVFLPDDIHSIHVDGTEPTLHFHLYGRPLETLTGRIGIHPETGEIANYNRSQMRPAKVVP